MPHPQVVSSSYWDDNTTIDVGAVTWGNGAAGIVGVVSAANSLIGSSQEDYVGNSGITALSDGSYVVASDGWKNEATADVGAVTYRTPPTPPPPDTIGVYYNGVFYLRNSNSAGPADISAVFGSAAMLPVIGDWNGDGLDSIGVYDSSIGVFFLSNSNTTPAVNYNFVLGNPGDTPIAGKWDNTMSADGAGVFRPSNGLIYVKRNLVTGFADYTMVLGNPGDAAVAGDWDGNGFASIGVYRPSNVTFYLSNTVTNGIVFGDFSFVFGTATSKPVAGDWTGVGAAHVGVFLNGAFYLRNTFTTGPADIAFYFGPPGAYPVAGRWIAASPVLSSASGVLVAPPDAVAPTATRIPNPLAPSNSSGGRFD